MVKLHSIDTIMLITKEPKSDSHLSSGLEIKIRYVVNMEDINKIVHIIHTIYVIYGIAAYKE